MIDEIKSRPHYEVPFNNFGKGKSKIVAENWWNGRATFVDV